VTVAEIIAEGVACAHEGAAIVHVHAYDEVTRRQRDDWEIYARIIKGIRGHINAIGYPTIPIDEPGFANWSQAKEAWKYRSQVERP
jgi:uncharacterized protein (DUF849 family)